MAYFLSGSVIINDSRELIGINTAGISTALYVGENIELDAASGIITATQYFGDGSNLTGVGLTNTNDYDVNNLVAIGSVTAANFYGDGSALINIPGLSWIATGTQTTRPDGTAIQDGDLYYDPTDLRQFTYYDGDAGGWRDSNPAANSAVSVTVGLETALVIPGEDTLTFEASPATGEIVIGINTVTDTLTFGIDDDLRVGTSLQVGAGISIFGNTINSANGTPIQYFGDGSNLTGIGLGTDSNIITTGDIQAGVITATTALEATVASGIGLTVTADAFIGGDLTVNGEVITAQIKADGVALEIVDQFDLNGVKVKIEQGGGVQRADLNASATTRIRADHIENTVDIVAGGDLFEFSAEGLLVGAGNSITAPEFYGDGSNLTGIGLAPDSDIITTGDIQAGIITATTSLEATVATGVGLTVTADAYVSGNLTVDTGATIRTSFTDSSSFTFETNFIDDEGFTRSETVAFDRIQTGLLNPDNSPNTSMVTAGSVLTYFNNAAKLNAGIVTATNSLEATAATGVGLTVTADAYIGGDVTVAGDLAANDVNTTSDVTKKENIQEIGDALSKVGQLKGVTFDWKESGQSSGGIIAQDVEKVLPTLVRDGDDHKTVIYNGIVGLLVQAVKELSAEVEELKQNK